MIRLIILLMVCGISSLQAANPSADELKLRESLRSALLQLRTMQSQRDNFEIAKTEAEQKNEVLVAQLETLTKQMAGEKEATEKSISDLTEKAAAQGSEIAKLRADLAQWKAAQIKAAETAATKEAERAKLAMQGIELQRRVADQRTKNLAMFKIGTEILSRYENFGLGTALLAREPFVGTTRVKLENLVQEYSDKLSEQRIKQ